MIVLGVLSLAVSIGASSLPADTLPRNPTIPDTSSFILISRIPLGSLGPGTRAGPGPDTVPGQRRRSVDVTEWYARRLTIHRYAAYTALPVFAFQYLAGEQLFEHGSDAPAWAKTGHRMGATALAGIFAVNTVTGAWNWWDSRSVKKGRVLRTLHAVSLLGADAAFTYAGVRLADEAENSGTKRSQHRTVALSAIGVSVASGLAMKLFNR